MPLYLAGLAPAILSHQRKPPTPQKTKPNSGKLAEAVYCVVNFCRADECTTKSDNPTITSNGGDGDLFVCLFFSLRAEKSCFMSKGFGLDARCCPRYYGCFLNLGGRGRRFITFRIEIAIKLFQPVSDAPPCCSSLFFPPAILSPPHLSLHLYCSFLHCFFPFYLHSPLTLSTRTLHLKLENVFPPHSSSSDGTSWDCRGHC